MPLTWIFHELRLLKIRERGYFTIVVYVERPMTKEIQQSQLAQRVSNFDKKNMVPGWYKLYPTIYRFKIKNIVKKQSNKQFNLNHS